MTIHHWFRTSPEFKAAVDQAKRLYSAAVDDELNEYAAAALKALRDLIENPDTRPTVRLKAALAVLQRPPYPDPGWQLPSGAGSRCEQNLMEDLDRIGLLPREWLSLTGR